MSITIDVDTGGTFTDGFATRDDETISVKVDTTPHDLTEGFIACLQAVADRFALSLEELLKETSVIRYSTTFGTNSIIQRTGPRLGVIVTSGHESDLYGPTKHNNAYDWLLAEGLVEGIPVEIDDDGEIQGTIDEHEVRQRVIDLLENGARCLVVAIKGSHRSAAAELSIRGIVRREFPRHFLGALPTLISAEISKSRDDELRLHTGLLSSYIHHGLARHLYKAEEEIRRRGYTKPLLVVHANGAVARVAKSVAAHTYNSGPAAGLVGSNELGRELGISSGLTLDIGGTSTDIGALGDTFAAAEESVTIDGIAVDVPSMVAESLGGGGGSIARVEDGAIKVGPQSAGARPGPICYGLGGEQPTVTDANLLLGYLNPATFLGGRRELDIEMARAGIKEHIADPLGISTDEAAWQIRQAVDKIIADGLASYSEAKGLDPDVLFAYGGGGPNHVSAVADLVGIDTAYCFPMSPVFSAYGSSRMDVCHMYETAVFTGSSIDVDSVVDGMLAEAERDMLGEGFDPASVSHTLEAGVSLKDAPATKIFVDLNGGTAVERDAIAEAGMAAFGERAADADDVLWESVRLRSVAPSPHPDLPSPESKRGPTPKEGADKRQMWTGESFEEVPAHDISTLSAGDLIGGPAVIDCEFTTILVGGGRNARVDGAGNVILEAAGSNKEG